MIWAVEKDGRAPRRPSVEELAEAVRRLERAERPPAGQRLSTGVAELDGLLPEGGLRAGALVEWLAPEEGSGAMTLALAAAREACRAGGTLVVVDPRREFYPLALPPDAFSAAEGAGGILVLRPSPARTVRRQGKDASEEIWAIDQSIRSPAVGAVVAWMAGGQGRVLRRLRLAAEKSGALGLFLRPASVRGEPSWADTRFLVEPLAARTDARRLRVRLLRCPGGPAGGSLELEYDELGWRFRRASAPPSPTRRQPAG